MVNSAYAKAAVEALVNWNGKSAEEAQEIVRIHSREEIEGMCWAEGSVKSGFEALVASLRARGIEISDEEKESVYQALLDGPEESPILRKFAEKTNGVDRNEIALEALTSIHDAWVANPKNVTKIHRVDKNGNPTSYMHTPIEMIGWNEVEKDYIFLKPIMENLGMPIEHEEDLVSAYEKKQAMFFQRHEIQNLGDLRRKLATIRDEYPALAEYPSEEKAMFNEENNERMAIQIVKKSGLEKLKNQNSLEEKLRRLRILKQEESELNQIIIPILETTKGVPSHEEEE